MKFCPSMPQKNKDSHLMVQNANPEIQRKDTGKIHLIWIIMAFKNWNLMNMGGGGQTVYYL